MDRADRADRPAAQHRDGLSRRERGSSLGRAIGRRPADGPELVRPVPEHGRRQCADGGDRGQAGRFAAGLFARRGRRQPAAQSAWHPGESSVRQVQWSAPFRERRIVPTPAPSGPPPTGVARRPAWRRVGPRQARGRRPRLCGAAPCPRGGSASLPAATFPCRPSGSPIRIAISGSR